MCFSFDSRGDSSHDSSNVRVDDIFAVGKKERCDQFGEDLNRMVPVKNLGELK